MALVIFESYGFKIEREFAQPKYFWTIVYASGIFLLTLHSRLFEKIGRLKIIQQLSKCSFCIYLIHPIGIHILYKVFHLFPYKFIPIIGELTIWIAVSVISLIGALILRKIPKLREIL